ncbi:hypothetical protein LCGC14_0626010 [marine sediment metagenome]|uniref:Uncharacterized protein n=1 Tax=marine sediment metagenome TaxID=412755 RepID=A0A0F9TPR1_9ZZZZ
MTITIPASPIHTRIRLTPQTAAAILESPYSFAQDAEQHDGERWSLEVEYPMMEQKDGAPIVRAFTQAGRHDTFTFACGVPARGTATTFVPNGGSGTNTLPLTGTISGTLKDGDMVSMSDGTNLRLYVVAADVADGAASIPVWPKLRGTPGAAVAVGASARGTFRLVEDGFPYDIITPILYDVLVKAVEAL